MKRPPYYQREQELRAQLLARAHFSIQKICDRYGVSRTHLWRVRSRPPRSSADRMLLLDLRAHADYSYTKIAERRGVTVSKLGRLRRRMVVRF